VKVVLFSTYPPAQCGIGDYTRQLRRGVEGADPAIAVEVVAERDPVVHEEVDSNVVRAWHRSNRWNSEATSAILACRPDVVHIQHEEAILGQDGRLIRFLEALGHAGISRVVTLHSVYGGRFGVPFWWPPPMFHRAIAANSEAIVVHQQMGGRDFLERHGIPPEKIHVIPHGTAVLEVWSRADSRRRLRLPVDARVALFFGVIHRKKNLHTAVAAAARIATRMPAFQLVIAGQARDRTPLDAIYARGLLRRMRTGTAAGWLHFRNAFVPPDEIAIYLAAADVVLFPHDQRYGSASGVFHLALAAARASICSLSPKFGEARDIFGGRIPGAFAAARDIGAWAGAIETMLSNPGLLNEAEELARGAAVSTSWQVVGRTYARLYRELVGRKPAASARLDGRAR
jgi:glycosyltransferase involved in cell wall biosynthesis